MDPIPVIPTPLGQRIRHFCASVLPPLVFGCTVLLIISLWRDCITAPVTIAEGGAPETAVQESIERAQTNLLAARLLEAASDSRTSQTE